MEKLQGTGGESWTMPAVVYAYRARLARLVDADTVDLEVVLGFGVLLGRPHARFRLLGLDTPETYGPTASEAGRAATRYAQAWFDTAAPGAATEWPLLITSHKGQPADRYGRYLAVIYNATTGACLNRELLTSGHAVPYPAPKGAQS